MDIKEILSENDLSKRVELLQKGRGTDPPNIEEIKKQWDPYQHTINDKHLYKDKEVWGNKRDGDGNPIPGKLERKPDNPVVRTALSYQELIVFTSVSFLFGNPVKLSSNDDESKLFEAIKGVLKGVKSDSLNRNIATELLSATEVAECWYPAEAEKHTKYGFSTEWKMRTKVFSPLLGDKLFPYMDEFGDMVAFSREYIRKEDEKEVKYFETWTAETYTKLKSEGSSWVEETTTQPLSIKKIPIVYGYLGRTDWHNVQGKIERLERSASKLGNRNDYHASPKTIVKGKIAGWSDKGEDGSILEMEKEADVSMLQWEQSPESVKLELDFLADNIFMETQTPRISVDSAKGLGTAASGETFKMIFLAAHLKVKKHQQVFDEYLERRINILKEFLIAINRQFSSEADKLDITSVITPFMIDNTTDMINNLVTAKAAGIISGETATTINPQVTNGAEEWKKIKAEAKEAMDSAMELNNLQNEEI